MCKSPLRALMDSDGTFRYAPNIPGVVNYPLVPRVTERLDVPVVAENDATAATWAEAKYGAGRGSDNMAFVALGTGIGTGFGRQPELHELLHWRYDRVRDASTSVAGAGSAKGLLCQYQDIY